MDIRKFNRCCISRLKFFCNADSNVDGSYEINENESLLPGTELDRVGHFVLRCFCLDRPQVTDFIVRKESELFLRRVSESQELEIRKFCDKSLKDLRKTESFRETNVLTSRRENPYFCSMVLSAMNEILYALRSKQSCRHFKTTCDEKCEQYFVKIPFQVVTSMVKARQVRISGGNAYVPCGKWTELLRELFVHHYNVGLSMISYSVMRSIRSDVRWQSTFRTLRDMYECHLYRPPTPTPIRRSRVLHQQVDEEKAHFPPCMSHLLNVLRKNHRLTHIWRYNFSLFLKDIGLTLQDSVAFWKKEYSQSCSAEASCTHSWQQNERKYRYSIRHLYGLEGAKVERSCKSCKHIQTMQMGMRDEGGCPFVHFDDSNLLSSLHDSVKQDRSVVDEINELRNSGLPSEACSLHMRFSSRSACQVGGKCELKEKPPFESPVGYYFCKKGGNADKSLEW